jgi:hypothetical protein
MVQNTYLDEASRVYLGAIFGFTCFLVQGSDDIQSENNSK